MRRLFTAALVAVAALGAAACTPVSGPGLQPDGSWNFVVVDDDQRLWHVWGCLGGGRSCGEAIWHGQEVKPEGGTSVFTLGG